MESTESLSEADRAKYYNYAAQQLVHNKKNDAEVIDDLVSQGLDKTMSSTIVADLQRQIIVAKKERAKKDMLYGALWCVGGIGATAANIGFFFWGAIIFGGIQLFKGVVNYYK